MMDMSLYTWGVLIMGDVRQHGGRVIWENLCTFLLILQ